MTRNTLCFLAFVIVLAAAPVHAQPPVDDLNGKTIHVYLPSDDWDTLWLVNGEHVLRKTAPYWHSVTLSGKDIYQQDFFFRTREYRLKLSKAGFREQEGARFTVPDFQGKDTMWIIVDPSGPVSAAPTVLLEPPKIVNILNPWQTTGPRLVLAGGPKGMATLQDHCGWFMAFLLKPADTKLHFQEINGTDTYGSGGFGSAVNYDLDPVFASKGVPGPLGLNLWLDTDNNTWLGGYPNKDGACQYMMAATVRDFSREHADFDFGGLTGDHIVTGMVQNGLSPARKPIRTAKTYSPNLFNNFDSWWVTDTTNANPKLRAYETCTDIPMSKSSDGLWEYDSYRTPQHGFYPIDAFDRHADARTPSCYNLPSQPSQWVTNQPAHNMNFCMESHAKFIYQRGQRFEFRGDDDVWVYIDGKLAIDLGGVHTPQADTIDLDQLSLVPGKEYNWDFFYCERQPCGSSLKIKTSIFFRQQRALDTVLSGAGGIVDARIIKREGGTGSCAGLGDTTLRVVDAKNLTYQLWDANGKVVAPLGEGPFFGGISIATPRVTVDTAKITGLAAGNYRIVAFEPANERVRVEIPFKVNPRNLVEFEPNQDKVVPLGTLVRVIVANREKGALVAQMDRYAPNFPPGLDVYQDSAKTQKVGPATALFTHATGYDTLWVIDTAMAAADKIHTLSIPLTTPTVKLTFVVPKNKVEFEPPYTGTFPLGTLVPVIAANREGGVLVAQAGKYTPTIPAGLEVYLDQGRTQRVAAGTQLTTETNGYDTLWVTGTATATTDQTYVLSIPGSAKNVSLTFLVPKNRVEFQPPPFARTAPMNSLVQLTARNMENGQPVAKAESYSLVIPPGLEVYADAAKTQRVAAGAVLTTAADGWDTLWVTADSVANDLETAVHILRIPTSPQEMTLTFTMPPLDIPKATLATIHDDDGDGIPDRLVVTYDRNITATPPKAAAYRWPASAAAADIPDVPSRLTGPTLTHRGALTAAIATGGEGLFTSTYQARKRDSVQTLPILDKMGPILLKAEMLLGQTHDTLRLKFSEPVQAGQITGAPADLFGYKVLPDAAPTAFVPAGLSWNADHTEATLVFLNTVPEIPRAGNLVRINDGAGLVVDAKMNGAGPASRFRVITGLKRSQINTVTYKEIAPSQTLLQEKQVAPSLQPINAVVEEVVERTGRMGHLIKTDLGDFAVGDDFNPVQASQVSLDYQASYFTNHGTPVASDKRTLACTDPVFLGDCLKNRGFLFVGWNYTSKNGARVGTGAYVSRIRYTVKVAGKVRESGGLDQTWGVLRRQ